MTTAAPANEEIDGFGLEEIPFTDLDALRRWMYRGGPSPALNIEDSGLRNAYAEHLEMVKEALTHPVPFALSIGLEVFPQQVTTTAAVLGNPKVTIRGCHSSGKTFMLAVISVWWLLHYEDSIVITTAPTQRQVSKIMWNDIRAIAPMVMEALRIKCRRPDTTQWIIGPKNFAEGVATDKTVNFQGFHSQNTLIIMDEAPGLDADLWGAIEGITSSGAVRIAMAGNPTIVSGMFYEACTSEEHEEWHRVKYSALRDNPNVIGLPLSEWTMDPRPTGLTNLELGRLATLTHCDVNDLLLDEDVTPHMVRRRWIRERWFTWGARQDPDWWSRVCGEFPPEDEQSLISRSHLDRARRRGMLTLEDATRLNWGIDYAGPGQNDTVMVAQQDLQVLGIWTIPDPDPRPIIQDYLQPFLLKTDVVRVDSIAIGWTPFLDLARWVSMQPCAVEVIGVDVGKQPMDKGKFLNLRAEIFWLLREFFIDGRMSDVWDEQMRRELMSLRWEYVEQGSKIKLESKKDMKERGVPSPDKADALALACCGFYAGDVQEKGSVRTEVADDFQISPF